MKIKATYIGPKDSMGFKTGQEYILTVGKNDMTKTSIIWAEAENIRAKFSSLQAFFLIFDNIQTVISNQNNVAFMTVSGNCSIADQVSKILGYKSSNEFYKSKPTLLQKEKFTEICKDRTKLRLELHQKSIGIHQ